MHITVHGNVAEEQVHRRDEHGVLELQSHFTILCTSSGAGKAPSGNPTGICKLLEESYAQPYSVGSMSGGSDSIVKSQITPCKCALLTFSIKAFCVGGKAFRVGAVFLAFDVF